MKIHLLLALAIVTTPVSLLASNKEDRALETAARTTFALHVVLGDTVQVTAKDGVVTLGGGVSDHNWSLIAENTVKQLPGVTRVQNQIGEGNLPSDARLTQHVRNRVLMQRGSDLVQVLVARSGVVKLSGDVDDAEQKAIVVEVIGALDGVTKVENELHVRGAGAERTIVVVDDASLNALVTFAIVTNRRMSALYAGTATKDGVVTLSGGGGTQSDIDYAVKVIGTMRGVKSVVSSIPAA